MDKLTQRQQQVMDFISRCIDTLGAPPTLQEISAHIGISGTVTALHHIAETVIVGKLLKTLRSYD